MYHWRPSILKYQSNISKRPSRRHLRIPEPWGRSQIAWPFTSASCPLHFSMVSLGSTFAVTPSSRKHCSRPSPFKVRSCHSCTQGSHNVNTTTPGPALHSPAVQFQHQHRGLVLLSCSVTSGLWNLTPQNLKTQFY